MIDEKVRDLSLMLIYLTGWEENKRNGQPGEKVFRAWKGYSFDILNELETMKMLRQFPNTQSIILTEEGKGKAAEIKRKYF
jgi:hypothetical protein